jgi:ribokinase
MIHVLGSINIDYGCQMQRLPGAGETVHANQLELTPGGKGANQALAASRAGGDVAMHGAIGSDEVAAQALSLLQAANVSLDDVRTADGTTGCAFVFVDAAGENQIVVLAGANDAVSVDQANTMSIDKGDTLLLQFEVPLPTVQAAAANARQKGATVIASLAPYYTMPESYFQNVDVLLVNQTEAQLLCADLNIHTTDDQTVTTLAQRLGCSIIQTLGKRGLQGFDVTTGKPFELPGITVEAIDTVGAGDTFAGYLGAMMDRERSLQNSCKVANAAAAFACTKPGAQSAIPAIAELGELVGAHAD